MRATVVIPTFHRAPLLALVLGRLAAQTRNAHPFEVIVVDDGTPDDSTRAVVAACDLPHLHCLRQPRSGAGPGRNRGIAVATGRILVFLDDDAFVGPRFLERHLALHNTGRDTLVAGGIVQVRDIPESVDENPGLRAYHRHPMPGGNASVPALAVRKAGGFDPWFHAYGWQDQELAERLLAAGLRRRFAWGAPIYHYKPPAYDVDMAAQLLREGERGRMGARFYHKHRRLAIGITTKSWPPLQPLIAGLSRAGGVERLLQHPTDALSVVGWRAALLRARAEALSAEREWAVLNAQAESTPARPAPLDSGDAGHRD